MAQDKRSLEVEYHDSMERKVLSTHNLGHPPEAEGWGFTLFNEHLFWENGHLDESLRAIH